MSASQPGSIDLELAVPGTGPSEYLSSRIHMLELEKLLFQRHSRQNSGGIAREAIKFNYEYPGSTQLHGLKRSTVRSEMRQRGRWAQAFVGEITAVEEWS